MSDETNKLDAPKRPTYDDVAAGHGPFCCKCNAKLGAPLHTEAQSETERAYDECSRIALKVSDTWPFCSPESAICRKISRLIKERKVSTKSAEKLDTDVPRVGEPTIAGLMEAGRKLNEACDRDIAAVRESYEASISELKVLIRSAVKAHGELERSAPIFELALRNRLSGRMYRLSQEIGDDE